MIASVRRLQSGPGKRSLNTMYIKTQDGFADGDLANLERLLKIVDDELSTIDGLIRESSDPDSEGLFDRGEYMTGVALTAIQQYIGSTYSQFKINRAAALRLAPNVNPGLTLVSVLNAGANYWKHQDEWGLRAVVTRDVELLGSQAQQTIKIIESLTPWSDYTCSNLISSLVGNGKVRLMALVPQLILWRQEIDLLNAEIS